MLDLTDFIKEYVEELQRKQKAILVTSNERQYVNKLYDECFEDEGTMKTEESIDTLKYHTMHEVWKDVDNAYEFFFTEGEAYSVNVYDRAKYENKG